MRRCPLAPRLISLAAAALAAASVAACSDGPEAGMTRGADGGTFAFQTNDAGVVVRGCTPNPANVEIPDNGCDDDADGIVDAVPRCDMSLNEAGSAEDFAKALGVCRRGTAAAWGLVSASYTGSYGSDVAPNPGQHGILKRFGSRIAPRHGSAFGVLSSGVAREFNGEGGAPFKRGLAMSGPGRVPDGFPQAAEGCQVDSAVYDVATVKLTLRVPDNARGVAFDFNYYSGEWPEWVCSRYNDGFVAMLTSKATGGVPTNISFDGSHNSVSVNNVYFDRCTAGALTGCKGSVVQTSICQGGESELEGTGFANGGTFCGDAPSSGGGSTGWLTSQAPVVPGETIVLEFIIWDTGDSNFDSSVLLDNLRWSLVPTETRTERPK